MKYQPIKDRDNGQLFPLVIVMLFSFCAFLDEGRGEEGHAASGTSKTEYFCQFFFLQVPYDDGLSITA